MATSTGRPTAGDATLDVGHGAGGPRPSVEPPPPCQPTLVREADDALSRVSGFRVVHHVEIDDGGTLCGADAPPGEDG